MKKSIDSVIFMFVVLLGVFLLYPSANAASGDAMWATDGVPICTAANIQSMPEPVSDGSGGAIITWEDKRGGTYYDIYAQRINAYGAVQWAPNGVAVCTEVQHQRDPELVSDGSGGAVITWEDNRAVSDYHIYAQKINANNGSPLWLVNGVAICTATDEQRDPKIVSDGSGGAIVTWEDKRGADYDIYAQRIDTGGIVKWLSNGEAISTAVFDQLYPQLIAGSSGDAILTWQDSRGGTFSDIYAQRIDTNGNVLWAPDGLAISTPGNELTPQLVSDGSGGAIISWPVVEYNPTPNMNIYAQRVDVDGEPLWTSPGVPIVTEEGTQWFQKMVSNGDGGAVITWQDDRAGTNDIYAQGVGDGGLFTTWYFAEGTTQVGYDQYLTISNHTATDADVTVTYMDTSGTTYIDTLAVAAYSRGNSTPGDALPSISLNTDIAATVTSTNGVSIVAERPIYFNGGNAGHNTIGATATATTWYFAEGTTQTGFDQYITISNPTATDADVTVMYMDTAGVPYTHNLTVTAYSRVNSTPGDVTWPWDIPDDTDIAATVTSNNGVGIVAERPIYFNGGNAGHNTIGATATATTWYFAEGTTQVGYDQYITILNPTATDANVTVLYMDTTGGTYTHNLTVAAYSRGNSTPGDVDPLNPIPSSTDIAATVTSTNGVGIVAERPIYFNGGNAGHNTIGVSQN